MKRKKKRNKMDRNTVITSGGVGCPSIATCQLVFVTPEMAGRLLTANGKNRNIRRPHVSKIQKEIIRGEWYPDASVIRVDIDGKLQDGQHRLSAVVASGVGVWMWVMTNTAADAMSKIDSGKSRNIADRLKLWGVDPKYLNQKVSFARMLAILDGGSYADLSVTECAEVFESYGASFDWVFSQPLNDMPSSSAGVIVPMVWLYGNGYQKTVETIIREISSYQADSYSAAIAHIAGANTKVNNVSGRIAQSCRILSILKSKYEGTTLPRSIRLSASGYDFFSGAEGEQSFDGSRCRWQRGCANDSQARGSLCQVHATVKKGSGKAQGAL